MTKNEAPIPSIDDAGLCEIDVATLRKLKLLIAAASGAGKSWLMRRLLEQTFGTAQQFVIDPEGEYHTLREQYPYLLVGVDGDIPLDIEDAPRLARQLLEDGTSAIFDLSELGDAQGAYVAALVGEGIMNAPRALWHALVLAVDECHYFAPENGAGVAASTEAIKRFATAGRKRGASLWAATQRVAELHKTVVAHLANKLIGRLDLENDIDRARKSLGMSAKVAYEVLPQLEDGQFYAVGRAFTHYDTATAAAHHRVTLVKTGCVRTTHPDASSGPLPPTPTPAKLKATIAKFSQQAAERKAEEPPPVVERGPAGITHKANYEAAYERVVKERDDYKAAAAAHASAAFDQRRSVMERVEAIREIVNDVQARLTDASGTLAALVGHLDPTTWGVAAGAVTPAALPVRQPIRGREPKVVITRAGGHDPDGPRVDDPTLPDVAGTTMPAMDRAIISIGTKPRSGTFELAEVRFYTGYAPSGKLGTAWKRCRDNGWIDERGTTEEGLRALADANAPLFTYPVGRALREKLVAELPTMESTILAEVCAVYPNALAFEQFRVRTGYAASGKLGTAWKALCDRLLVTKTSEGLRADPRLVDLGEKIPRTPGFQILQRLLREDGPLDTMQRALLKVVADNQAAGGMTFAEVRARTSYAASGKLGTAWKALRDSLYLRKVGPDRYALHPELETL